MQKLPEPPEYLGKKDRKFWRNILKDYQIAENHSLELLGLAGHCLDRIAECREQIDKDGAFFKDRWSQFKEHPAAKSERDQKTLLARLLRELCLDIQPTDNRIPERF